MFVSSETHPISGGLGGAAEDAIGRRMNRVNAPLVDAERRQPFLWPAATIRQHTYRAQDDK